MLTAIWLAFGACLGSFANVLIHRLPRDKSVVWPASHCPRCRKPLAWHDNVPVLAFLLLGGRCRFCRKPISRRYPLVEIVVALLAWGLSVRWPDYPLWTAAAAAAACALTAVALIDWETFLIPDLLSLGLLAGGLACSPLNPTLAGGPAGRFFSSALGAAVGFGICWGTAVFGEMAFKKEAMGGGDIKLLAAVGAWSGALGAFDCLVVGSFLGAIYGGAMLLRRKLKRQEPIPFGPFLSAAAAFNFFYVLPFGFPFLR